jgi:hypothetical protein
MELLWRRENNEVWLTTNGRYQPEIYSPAAEIWEALPTPWLRRAELPALRQAADFPNVDDPLLARCFAVFDQIACVHMSGLFVRSHMNAGQDGFRDKSSKQNGDLKRATGKCGMSLVGDRLITPSAHHLTSSGSAQLQLQLLPVSG